MKQILIFTFFILVSFPLLSQNCCKLELNVSVSPELKKDLTGNGRLFIFISKDENPAPIYQRPSLNKFGFAVNLKNLSASDILDLNKIEPVFSDNRFSLNKFPEGKYFIQAIFNQTGGTNHLSNGNLFSRQKEITVSEGVSINLILSELLKRKQSATIDSTHSKYIELKSRLLSEWWKKPITLKASVLLPGKYYENPNQKYPVRINIGGYGSHCNRIEHLLKGNSDFTSWWFSDEAPQIITIFLEGDGPFGDPYFVDSENNGPYGRMLSEELIPYIEKKFRGIGKPSSRFLDGCSTGGWVSLALQIFYPGYFNGAWSFSPDPVDFHHLQLIDIYNNKNAFYNQFNYLTPSARSKTGQPRLSVKHEVTNENLRSFNNTYTTSKGQWGAWNAAFSPKGKDGLPAPVFDPVTGKIDSTIAAHWKKYDLLNYLKSNWKKVGPKIQNKIWIWMGDMDQFYLNNAMREFDGFLKSVTNPQSFATVTFEPMKGHCEEFDHRWVLEMIQEKIEQDRNQY